jgi:hypothetical protein
MNDSVVCEVLFTGGGGGNLPPRLSKSVAVEKGHHLTLASLPKYALEERSWGGRAKKTFHQGSKRGDVVLENVHRRQGCIRETGYCWNSNKAP